MTIFIIVGLVIGGSIWVSPASYLSRTGPAIFLAYLLAIIPAIFVAYCCAYIGSTLPIAGGSYMVGSRLMGKFVGFMVVWMIILAVCAALAFLAAMFALFMAEIFLIPEGSKLVFVIIVGVIVLIAFYLINILRIQISGLVEMIITIVGDILVMIIFLIAAIPFYKPSNFEPLFPLGISPVLFAALVFFFSYTGFTLVLEVAGEVKNPQKNIPRALLISIPILIILYTLQALMVAGIHRWDEPVGTVTELILLEGVFPPVVLIFITILIALAIASSLHPLYLAFSRDFLMAGRDELFPKTFAKLHKTYKTPVQGLTLLLIISIVFLLVFFPLFGPIYGIATTAVLLSAVTAVVVLILQVPLCLGAWLLPKKFPELHEKAGFKPSLKTLKIMATLGMISSIVFILLLVTDPDAGLIIALIVFPFALLGVVIYIIRLKVLKRRGIDLDEVVKKWPEEIIFD